MGINLTYKQEFLFEVEEDCKDLIKEHWEEIAVNKDKIKLNPDWDIYRKLEELGNFKIFTVRSNGVLVGYFAVIVNTNPHYKDHLFASNDVIFLKKEYRKGLTGVKLIKFATECLKADGVSVLTINTKAHKPFDKVLNFLGFSLTERVYSKYLGD